MFVLLIPVSETTFYNIYGISLIAKHLFYELTTLISTGKPQLFICSFLSLPKSSLVGFDFLNDETYCNVPYISSNDITCMQKNSYY